MIDSAARRAIVVATKVAITATVSEVLSAEINASFRSAEAYHLNENSVHTLVMRLALNE